MKYKLIVLLVFVLSIPLLAAPTIHQSALTWNQSTSPNIDHDCVYRGITTGGPYTQLFCSATKTPITAYLDLTVKGGQTYYYVTTAVDVNNTESGYSNESKAVIPQDVLPNTNLSVASQ